MDIRAVIEDLYRKLYLYNYYNYITKYSHLYIYI